MALRSCDALLAAIHCLPCLPWQQWAKEGLTELAAHHNLYAVLRSSAWLGVWASMSCGNAVAKGRACFILPLPDASVFVQGSREFCFADLAGVRIMLVSHGRDSHSIRL